VQRRDVLDCPELRIVDLTHEVTPFSILDGARFWRATPFPPARYFVVVIDPGWEHTQSCGGEVKRGQYFVLPDNGLMTLGGIATARSGTGRLRIASG
jgi:S-adenosylmethionine hydrolase